jgi:flagellar basal-body rod protein FlgF
MENTSLIALSRAVTLERQMAVVANNVANMNTTGFKSESPLFVEYLMRPNEDEHYSMVQDQGTVRNIAPGPLQQTGNPLDMALEGDGYFELGTLDGPRYTRAGTFTMNADRVLVNIAGLPVMDETGNEITIPPNISEITVAPDGNIFTERGPLAKIGVFHFRNEQGLKPLGNGLLVTQEKPEVSENTLVRQGFVEQSNVQSVVEMTSMISVSRQYEGIQKLLQAEHDRLRNAYTKLSRIA